MWVMFESDTLLPAIIKHLTEEAFDDNDMGHCLTGPMMSAVAEELDMVICPVTPLDDPLLSEFRDEVYQVMDRNGLYGYPTAIRLMNDHTYQIDIETEEDMTCKYFPV